MQLDVEEAPALLSPGNHPDESPAVLCEDLAKRYGALTAVDGIRLRIERGECFGLLGPNGAGKTTTVEILEGLNEPDRGTVEVLGRRWGSRDDRRLRQRIGVQLQEARFAEKLTVLETLRVFRSFYAGGQEVGESLRSLALEDKARTRVGRLSGGQKQRLALACALVGRPELLFLDEPTTGLDPQARIRTWTLVEGLRANGVTILLTTHYMEEASRLCDRVAILDRGRIIAQGTPSELVRSLGGDQLIELNVQGPLDDATLAGLPCVTAVDRRGDRPRLSVTHAAGAIPALVEELDRQGARLGSLSTHQATLEDVFVGLTGRRLRDE